MKTSKFIFTLLCAAFLLTVCGCNSGAPVTNPTPTEAPTETPTETPTPTKKPLTINHRLTGLDAFEITNLMTVGWNLGNCLDSNGPDITYDSTPAKAAKYWGNEEPTKELFTAIKNAGFNTVRIPITWYQHIQYDESAQKYVINPDWLAYVKKTVDYANSQKMFVIINVHHEDWVNVPKFTDETYEKAAAITRDIWSQLAETFKYYDQHLIFEGFNEPRQTGLGSSVEWGTGDAVSRRYINNLLQVFVDTVRSHEAATNKERLLMLTGYCASSDKASFNAIEIPENIGNYALSVHAYLPYYFCMDTSDKANHTFPGKSGYGEDYQQAINNFFSALNTWKLYKKAPIIIGECGASDFNNTEDRVAWATYFFEKAKSSGITCVLWDNQNTYDGTGEAYGLICRSTQTWFPNSLPVVQAIMDVYGIEAELPTYREPEPEVFDWSSLKIEDDWVEIYRSENGLEIETWGNLALENWKPYLNENYEFIMIYTSDDEPYMVLQGGWHKVFASVPSNSKFLVRFTFKDVMTTVKKENVVLEDIYNYYASANSKPMTLYGVYAVPVK